MNKEKKGNGRGRPISTGVHYYLTHGEIRLPSKRSEKELRKALDEIRKDFNGGLKQKGSITPIEERVLDDLMGVKTIIEMTKLYISKAGVFCPKTLRNRRELKLHNVLERSLPQYLRLQKEYLQILFPEGLSCQSVDAQDAITYVESVYSDPEKEAKGE